ncbi:MAG: hypothetical protein AAFY52_07445, partial [Pseudomonadota bacterium]
MKIATASYPLDVLPDWAAYEDKLTAWVGAAAQAGAQLLVFPEYAAMELATLAGLDVAGDLEASLFAVADRLEDADALHAHLAGAHNVHILAGSGPATDALPDGVTRPVNRARNNIPLFGLKAGHDLLVLAADLAVRRDQARAVDRPPVAGCRAGP